MPSKIAKTPGPGSRSRQGKDNVNGPEQRKLRNRMSQRAFRARQAMRIQELEERLEQLPAPDAAYVTQLQDQNALLREQLLSVHKKAIGIQISLKALADAAARALGIDQPVLDEYDHKSSSSASEQPATPPLDSTAELERHSWQTTSIHDTVHTDLDSMSYVPVTNSATSPITTERLSTPQILQNGVNCTWAGENVVRLNGFGTAVHEITESEGCTSQILELDGMADADFAQHSFPQTPLCHLPSPLGQNHYTDLIDRGRPYCNEFHVLKSTTQVSPTILTLLRRAWRMIVLPPVNYQSQTGNYLAPLSS
ncbi:hypothetical protein AC578_7660 [Pseudocercospora eumusae]|uniref:BZIP domain-containing protein n=1 Tax=Pseudocercospora eumusae TaxID=321146 RepID=A0A139GXQ4_9PEZI|nr:hypothetical protein AC578_7660 [Pseudocercospora eumusae]